MQNLFLMSRSSFDNIIRLPYVYIDETWWLQHTIQIITAKIQQFTYEGYILVFVPAGGKLLIDIVYVDVYYTVEVAEL